MQRRHNRSLSPLHRADLRERCLVAPSPQLRERILERLRGISETPGVGLGLNLVAAIVKLHGFRMAIRSGPGCRVEIVCPDPQD